MPEHPLKANVSSVVLFLSMNTAAVFDLLTLHVTSTGSYSVPTLKVRQLFVPPLLVAFSFSKKAVPLLSMVLLRFWYIVYFKYDQYS